jgi:hypothetical protein
MTRDDYNSFSQIHKRRWKDPDWRIGCEAIGLYDLLKSYPTRNWAGVLPYQPKKWARDSGDSVETVARVLADPLIPTGLVAVDLDTEEALVCTYFRDDIVWKNADTNVAGGINDMAKTESPLLRAVLAEELRLAYSQIQDRGLQKSTARAQEVHPALLPEGAENELSQFLAR